MYRQTEDTTYCTQSPAIGRACETSLWERILALVEGDLAERRGRQLYVEVRDKAGLSRAKEVGDLSADELRGLDPSLKQRVAELLLDRHLAQQGRVDLVDGRRAYTKKVGDLTPEDLPALVQADRWRVEEERERAEFARDARAGLERLTISEAQENARPLAARVSGLFARRA